MSKILCIGHITLDTFLKVEDVDMHCDLNTEECMISFGFGAKVPVKEVFYSVGGGAANTAVGLRNFGHEVSIASIIGSDTKGKDILGGLSCHQIDISNIEQDNNPTDQATIISYGIDRTIFTYGYARKYSIKNNKADYSSVYLSSVGSEVTELYKEIVQLKSAAKIQNLFYNPGSREIKNAREDMAELLTHVDHLIVNVEEGCGILNPGLKRSEIEIEDLMNLLNEKGPKNIILTDADNGSYTWSSGEFKHLKAIKTDVVEKTGAGDAYASGYIGAILHGYDIHKASQLGILNGAAVIKLFGAQNGLLLKDDMIKELGPIASASASALA
jgi:sugar/nucleoside kinase (ribokinase family)